MKKSVLIATMMLLLLPIQFSYAQTEKYVIYPVPHSMTMNDGSTKMTGKVNVVCESTIDKITKDRLTSVLAVHGIETVFEGTDENSLTICLGTIGSGESVESHAINELGLTTSRILVSKKYDRHAIKVHENGVTVLGEHTNAVFCALASLEQMLEQVDDNTLSHSTIYDYADQQNRGLVEGY